MKKLISLTLILIIAFQGVASAASVRTSYLTIDSAVKKAYAADSKMKIDQNNNAILQKAYKDSDEDAGAVQMPYLESIYLDIYPLNASYRTLITNMEKRDLTPAQKLSDLKINQLTVELDKLTTKIKANQLYYAYVKADADLAIAKKQYDLDLKDFQDSKTKYEQGLLSKNDFVIAECKKDTALAKYKDAELSKKKAQMDLNRLFKTNINTNIKLPKMNYKYTDLSDIDVEKAVQRALTNRLDMFKVSEALKLAQIEFNIVNTYYKTEDKGDDSIETDYQDAYLNLEEAKINMENKKEEVECEIRTGYNTLFTMLSTVENNKRDAKKKSIDYEVARLKYSLNMITKYDLDTIELEYQKANAVLNSSIADYNIEKVKFYAAQDVGPGL